MKNWVKVVAAGLVLPLVLVACSAKPAKKDEPSPIATTTSAPSDVNTAGIPDKALEIPGSHGLLDTSKYPSPDRRLGQIPDVKPNGFVDPPKGAGISRYYLQQVDWTSCGANKECADVVSPLDWQNPDGQAITLKIARLKSNKTSQTNPSSLFVNPGGPGGSGIDYLGSFTSSNLLSNYDIVAWDPRGSGESTPVVCGTGEETDSFYATDMSPDNEQEWSALTNASKRFADQCRANSGVLLDHISTLDTIQDLDLLRHLVGEEKLNYLGVSYGTYIGAMYAEFYPEKVGRMVLDSAVNITDDDSVIQAMGFELALNNWAEWCANTKCGLGVTKTEVLTNVDEFLRGLDQNPLKVGSRYLTQSLATIGIALLLYMDESSYPWLAEALTQAMRQSSGAGLLGLADAMYERKPNGEYGGLYYSFYAISCLDSPDPGNTASRQLWATAIEKAPIFSFNSGVDLVCPNWTAKPVPAIKAIGKGAAPIVVLGVTGDNATPYQQAEWMADQLESGVLVGMDGVGHGAYNSGNKCIKTTVDSYLIDGKVPADRTRC